MTYYSSSNQFLPSYIYIYICTTQPGFKSSLENTFSWFMMGVRHDLAYFNNDNSKSKVLGHITSHPHSLVLTVKHLLQWLSSPWCDHYKWEIQLWLSSGSFKAHYSHSDATLWCDCIPTVVVLCSPYLLEFTNYTFDPEPFWTLQMYVLHSQQSTFLLLWYPTWSCFVGRSGWLSLVTAIIKNIRNHCLLCFHISCRFVATMNLYITSSVVNTLCPFLCLFSMCRKL